MATKSVQTKLADDLYKAYNEAMFIEQHARHAAGIVVGVRAVVEGFRKRLPSGESEKDTPHDDALAVLDALDAIKNLATTAQFRAHHQVELLEKVTDAFDGTTPSA